MSFILFRKTEITLFSIRYLSKNSLKDTLLHLLDAFSKFSDDHPISAEIGSLVILCATWFSFVNAILHFSNMFAEHFSIVVYFGFFFLAVFFALVSVGLFEFIQERWGLLKTAVGLLATMILFYFIFITIEYFLKYSVEY